MAPPSGRDEEAIRDAAFAMSPGLFTVAEHGPVSFQHIAQTRRIRQVYPDRVDESLLLERMAKQQFAARIEDEISSEYWCQVSYGGCALTLKGRIFSCLNTYVPELVNTDSAIKQLSRDARRVFATSSDPDQQMEIAETLYSVMARLMASADLYDSKGASPEGREQALAAVRDEWNLAQSRTLALIQRQARFQYLSGAVIGALLTLVVFGCIGALAAVWWPAEIAAPAFLAATMAGTVGAVVSVIQRMSRQNLTLDYTASRRQKMVIGAGRPFVGGTFAAVVQFALLGGLLTMQNAATDSKSTPATFAFFALAGFAAGFSERFATDLLERAGASLSASDTDSPSTGGSNPPDTGNMAASVPPPRVYDEAGKPVAPTATRDAGGKPNGGEQDPDTT